MSHTADQPSSTKSLLSVSQFAERFRGEMIPLQGSRFAYFCDTSMQFTEEDSRDYLEDPVAALPPALLDLLPSRVSVFFVPYLCTGSRPAKSSASIGAPKPMVSMVEPPRDQFRWTAQLRTGKDEAVLAFTFTQHDVSEYHYRFYQHLAELVFAKLADQTAEASARSRYAALLMEELHATVHGEVDEGSWHAKQQLERRKGKVRADSTPFALYLEASFVDTLTLYLHGICCDIDVDTGPRQLPSRFLRKRLVLFKELFPPPADYQVLPEDMPKNGR